MSRSQAVSRPAFVVLLAVSILIGGVVVLSLFAGQRSAVDEPPLEVKANTLLNPGDRVVLLGNTFAERLSQFGHFEALLAIRAPELKLTFRNLGWSGDTPALQPRPLNFGDLQGHLRKQQPDVIFLCFGMNESFEGEAGLAKFTADLGGFIDSLRGQMYNGKAAPRLVLVGPIAHEDVGGDYPDPTEHNKQLALYSDAMGKLAGQKSLLYIDLFTPTSKAMAATAAGHAPLTINGIHLNRLGDWYAANQMYRALGLNTEGILSAGGAAEGKPMTVAARRLGPVMPAAKKVSPIVSAADFNTATLPQAVQLQVEGMPVEKLEQIRQSIVNRNQQFFYRWRALNGEYIYGRRKDWYGGYDFESEFKQFDQIIANLEKDIQQQVSALGETIQVRAKPADAP